MDEPIQCRLCLYNTNNYLNAFCDKLQENQLIERIVKYFGFEIKENDIFPKNICRKCIDRIEEFHTFYNEVSQNQETLQFSAAGLIHLHEYTVKTDEGYVVTFKTDTSNTTFVNFAPNKNVTSIIALNNNDDATDVDDDNDVINNNNNDNNVENITNDEFINTTTHIQDTISCSADVSDITMETTNEDNDSATSLSGINCQTIVIDNYNKSEFEELYIIANNNNKNNNNNNKLKHEMLNVIKNTETINISPTDSQSSKYNNKTDFIETNESNIVNYKINYLKKMAKQNNKKRKKKTSTVSPQKKKKTNMKNIIADTKNVPSEANREDEERDYEYMEDSDCSESDGDINANMCKISQITDAKNFQNEIDNNVDDDDDDDDDNDEDVNNDLRFKKTEINNEVYEGFPKTVIKDSKLLIRGKPLISLMSRFFRLECDLCSDSMDNKKLHIFKSLSSLCTHYNQTHSVKGYVICCGLKLVKPRAMAMHMSRHLQPNAFKCPECNKMMTCPKILQYHIQNHLPEEKRPLACSECPRKFSYSSALIAHMISHQPENMRDVHVCDECGKTFSSPGRLSTHINVAHVNHGHDYICHICAKQFSCRGNLTYHLTTHEPRIHQVQCTECGKWLKNKLCLRKHMVQHSLIRFFCELCDYSALNRQCLRNHVRVQHSDVKPFNCETCGKTFKLKNTLLSHIVQHTGDKKFECQFCSRKFASSGNYYSHRKRMHPKQLAELKLKQEEDERLLRESMKGSAQILGNKIKLENI